MNLGMSTSLSDHLDVCVALDVGPSLIGVGGPDDTKASFVERVGRRRFDEVLVHNDQHDRQIF
jgi:hypothetical protein